MACFDACPSGAIDIREINGFSYPSVDPDKCTACGRCVSVCSAIKLPETKKIGKAYIAVSRQREIYNSAASGGIFGTIAAYIIKEKHGAAFGTCMTEDCTVKHTAVDNTDNLHTIQGSKYVQSDCRGGFRDAERLLNEGRYVLFSGTPCQIGALKKYLGSEYDKLVCIDIVCHGVPSPFYFRYHIRKHYTDGKIRELSFRTKDKYDRYGFNLKIDDGKKSFFVPGNEDIYYRLFLKGESFRDCCYQCPYACSSRVGDISVGDCGNSKKYKDFHYDMTVSVVFPITDIGRKLWADVSGFFDSREANPEEEIKANMQLVRPSEKNAFREGLYEGGYEETEKKAVRYLGRPSVKLRIKNRLKRMIPERYRTAFRNISKGSDN